MRNLWLLVFLFVCLWPQWKREKKDDQWWFSTRVYPKDQRANGEPNKQQQMMESTNKPAKRAAEPKSDKKEEAEQEDEEDDEPAMNETAAAADLENARVGRATAAPPAFQGVKLAERKPPTDNQD
ncbi:hypothetical protein M3Y99_00557700 [Aphelenchoides fujianensis]|nr:hypothetical protein M3Y99_00557700 [Aphelenchoides fujianensis]